MKKTLKDFMEVYRPKSPDEQKFVDKHVTVKHKDRNGNGDDVFNATNVKTDNRKETRHGYDSGEDEKVYEELVAAYAEKYDMSIDEIESIIEEIIEEEAEDLEELSKKTLRAAGGRLLRRGLGDGPKAEKSMKSANLASAKLYPDQYKNSPLKAKVPATNEEVELEEGTVGYKNYSITAHPNRSAMREIGDIKHSYGHDKKLNKLGVNQSEKDHYGPTHHVTVKNNTTGDVTHHHVYQSYKKDSTGKPTISIRGVGKPHEQHGKHANVIAHYISGKTKIKEDLDIEFDTVLDEDTFTDASLANLRVMKHKQMMKELEKSSKIHPLMKVRRLSDAKKKLSALEADRDYHVAKHEKAMAKKKKVTEEVEEIDELSRKTLSSYVKKAGGRGLDSAGAHGMDYGVKLGGNNFSKTSKDKSLKKAVNRATGVERAADRLAKEEVEIDEKTLTPAEMKKREEVVKAIKRGNPKMDKSMAYAIATKTAKRVAEGVVPTADEPTEHDKKMAQKVRDLLAKEKKPVKEEVEEIDEGIATYDKKGKLVGNYKDLETAKKLKPGHHYAPKGTVLAALDRVGKPVWAPTFKEEVEDLDESAKIAAHLIKRYGDNVRKSHVVSAAKDFGVDASKLAKAVRTKLGKNTLGEDVEEIDEISKSTLASYIPKAARSATGLIAGATAAGMSNIPSSHGSEMGRTAMKRLKGIETATKKITKEDIINRTIEKYVPEELKYTPEERMLQRLEGLSDRHVETLMGIFESLNTDNQNKMLMVAETQEGINSLIDFAITNRGE